MTERVNLVVTSISNASSDLYGHLIARPPEEPLELGHHMQWHLNHQIVDAGFCSTGSD